MKRQAATKAEAAENMLMLTKAAAVLSNYGTFIEIEKVLSKNREPEIVYQRALIILVLRQKKISTPKIGTIINRDHATVLYLLNYGNKPRMSGHFQDKYNEFYHDYTSRDKMIVLRERIEYHENKSNHHALQAAQLERELKNFIKTGK